MWNKHMHDFDEPEMNPLKFVIIVFAILAVIGALGCIMQGPCITIDTTMLH